jgi:hypothetical protein
VLGALSSFLLPLIPLAGVDLAEDGLCAPLAPPSFFASPFVLPPFSLGDRLPLVAAATSLSSTTSSSLASPLSSSPPSSFLSFLASGERPLSAPDPLPGDRDLR